MKLGKPDIEWPTNKSHRAAQNKQTIQHSIVD